jgi:hypothetical protein
MAKFHFKTEGIVQTVEALKKYAKRVAADGEGLVRNVAQRIYDVSQTVVPVRDETRPDKPAPSGRPHNIPGGSLKKSGRVFKLENKNPLAQGSGWAVGYGGDMEDGMTRPAYYAVYVHEMPQIHLPPGQMKYLEYAVADALQSINELYQETFGGYAFKSRFFGTGMAGQQYAVLPKDQFEPRSTGVFAAPGSNVFGFEE